MGLFDKKVHKEEPELRKKRKNHTPEFKSTKDERKRDLGMPLNNLAQFIRYS